MNATLPITRTQPAAGSELGYGLPVGRLLATPRQHAGRMSRWKFWYPAKGLSSLENRGHRTTEGADVPCSIAGRFSPH